MIIALDAVLGWQSFYWQRPFCYCYQMQQKVQTFHTPPPNYSLRQHATNGFSQRPSLAQLAAYIIIAASIAVYFSSTLPLNYSPPLLLLYALFAVVMVVSAGLATGMDPTDRVVYYYKWSRHDRKITFAPEYDKVLFCEFCDSYCWASSKHCRSCNRCVKGFDHHCMWFNNCVGTRNYWQFFVSIVATFAYALIVVLHVALASFQVDFSNSGQLVRIVFSWVVAAVLAVFGFLIINLIFLHIYLMLTNQTTYQFLQRKKKEEEAERLEKEKQKNRDREELSIQNVRKPSSASEDQIFSTADPPQAKPIQLCSDDSINNTKIVIVQSQKPESKSHLESGRSKRKVSNDYFEEQLAKHSRKDEKEVENSVKSKEEENDTVMQGEEELSPEQSTEKLPNFFRKNRSIKLLLSATRAQNPSKKKLEVNQTFELRE